MNPLRTMVAGAAVVLLAGCGGMPGLGGKGGGGDTFVGWYCVDNPDTGIKDCEKRRLRNGVPVDDKVYERIGGPGKEPASVQPASRESPITTINPLGDSGLSVENQGPPPREVRPYRDWSEARSGSEEDRKREEL